MMARSANAAPNGRLGGWSSLVCLSLRHLVFQAVSKRFNRSDSSPTIVLVFSALSYGRGHPPIRMEYESDCYRSPATAYARPNNFLWGPAGKTRLSTLAAVGYRPPPLRRESPSSFFSVPRRCTGCLRRDECAARRRCAAKKWRGAPMAGDCDPLGCGRPARGRGEGRRDASPAGR